MGLTKPFAFMGSTADSGIGYGNPPYDQDLVAYYDFGDSVEGSWTGSATLTGGDTITDLSGNGFNSSLNAGSQTWTYETGTGKGVIATTSKAGGYFYMDAMTGSFTSFDANTFEFVGNIPIALTNDNLIFRFDQNNVSSGYSRMESNVQQYPSTPPKRIGLDVRTAQINQVNVGTINQDTGTGFFHLVYTAGQGETSKIYYQGSLLGQSAGTMSATDTFEWLSGTTNAWFGTSNYSGGTFPAEIGVFRMYNSAMPASSVTDNYNFYSPQF